MKATIDKYYFIKIVYNDGVGTGFFCRMNNVKGKMLPATINVWCADVMIFETYNEANAFALKNNFDKWTIAKYYIKDSFEMIDEIKDKSPANERDLFFIVNQAGWKCFFSEEKQRYYFDNKKFAYCVWFDEKSVTDAMNALQKRFPIMTLSFEKLEK